MFPDRNAIASGEIQGFEELIAAEEKGSSHSEESAMNPGI
jgi:hypothetical protein